MIADCEQVLITAAVDEDVPSSLAGQDVCRDGWVRWLAVSDEPPADLAAATPATESAHEPPCCRRARQAPDRSLEPGAGDARIDDAAAAALARARAAAGRRGCGRGSSRPRAPARGVPSRRGRRRRPRPQAARRPDGPAAARPRLEGRRRRRLGHGPVARDRRPRRRPALRAGRPSPTGVLTVRADSTAWATQIRLLTSSILAPARGGGRRGRRHRAAGRRPERAVVDPRPAPSQGPGPARHLRLSGCARRPSSWHTRRYAVSRPAPARPRRCRCRATVGDPSQTVVHDPIARPCTAAPSSRPTCSRRWPRATSHALAEARPRGARARRRAAGLGRTPTCAADLDPRAAPRGRRRRRPGAHGAGPHRTISDAAGTEDLPGTTVRREGEAATGDLAGDEAYDGLGATWELCSEAYGRNSLDGRGMPLLATVHYGRDYDNAFWDGTQMVFGDGDGGIFARFTAASTSSGTSSPTASPSTPPACSTRASRGAQRVGLRRLRRRSSSSALSARAPSRPTGSSAPSCSPTPCRAWPCAR